MGSMNPPPLRVAIATTADPLVVLPQLRALCEELERELQRPTSGHLMVSYEELERGAEADEFHLMWLPPMIALAVVPQGAAQPLAVPVRGGETSYATAIFTRPDSGIESIAALRGRSMGWVGHRSSAGYVLPRAFLAARGLDCDADLADQVMLGSHDKVVAAVLSGRVDAGAVYVNLRDGAIASGAWGTRAVHVLAHHGPIPADMIASGRAVSDEMRAVLGRRLVSEPDGEIARRSRALLRCDAFAPPEPSHLDALAALTS
jgi:phosphonate transport system substrate-binding protein